MEMHTKWLLYWCWFIFHI